MIKNQPKTLKYMQVETAVRELVERMEDGHRLPTERDLAKMLDCHVLTVRKGIQPLVDEGVLTRRVGSGTFVNPRSNDSRPPEERIESDYIGLLIPNKESLYCDRLVQALADNALSNEISLRSAWVNDFEKDVPNTVNEMVQSGCTVLILPWFPSEMNHQIWNFVSNCPVPVVLPELVSGLEHLCFESKDVFGSTSVLEVELICKYFLSMGCKRIHFIGPENTSSPLLQQKITAYATFAAKNNIEAKFGLFDSSQGSLMKLAKQEAKYKGDLAVISCDDAHAARFMTAMHMQGLEAPTDYRIVGHNDTSIAVNTVPPLTTIRENFAYISRAMIQSAKALSRGGSYQSKEMVKPQLVVRESCGGKGVAEKMDLPQCEIILNG
ncbi:substrate-binding domain-containing protein [Kiritimatiellaeota bacterium B1221]|nr:substrate-binding domain-containing protein [Kiritimatiellaeota bacterium B1221]